MWRRVVCWDATRRHIPEDDTLHNHRYENLKSYKIADIKVVGFVKDGERKPCLRR
jgi:hypothetical protein